MNVACFQQQTNKEKRKKHRNHWLKYISNEKFVSITVAAHIHYKIPIALASRTAVNQDSPIANETNHNKNIARRKTQ